MNRIGRAGKKRQLDCYDKVRKQEADMRDCARRLTAAGHDLSSSMRNVSLQHRQASRFRSTRKGRIERRDLVTAEHEVAGRGVFGGMALARGFWNRKHERIAREKTQGDLARRSAMRVGDLL